MRLTYKEVSNRSINLQASSMDLGNEDPNLTKCERFQSNVDNITLNWYYSYEGYLAHNEQKLKMNKSKI
jgi:hypothetical protein